MNCQAACTEVHSLVPCLRRLAPRPALHRQWPSFAQPAWCPSQQSHQPLRITRCAVVEGSERTAGTAGDQEEELQIEGIDKKCAALRSRLCGAFAILLGCACADMFLSTLRVFTAVSASLTARLCVQLLRRVCVYELACCGADSACPGARPHALADLDAQPFRERRALPGERNVVSQGQYKTLLRGSAMV